MNSFHEKILGHVEKCMWKNAPIHKLLKDFKPSNMSVCDALNVTKTFSIYTMFPNPLGNRLHCQPVNSKNGNMEAYVRLCTDLKHALPNMV